MSKFAADVSPVGYSWEPKVELLSAPENEVQDESITTTQDQQRSWNCIVAPFPVFTGELNTITKWLSQVNRFRERHGVSDVELLQRIRDEGLAKDFFMINWLRHVNPANFKEFLGNLMLTFACENARRFWRAICTVRNDCLCWDVSFPVYVEKMWLCYESYAGVVEEFVVVQYLLAACPEHMVSAIHHFNFETSTFRELAQMIQGNEDNTTNRNPIHQSAEQDSVSTPKRISPQSGSVAGFDTPSRAVFQNAFYRYGFLSPEGDGSVRPKRCLFCDQIGHFRKNCPFKVHKKYR